MTSWNWQARGLIVASALVGLASCSGTGGADGNDDGGSSSTNGDDTTTSVVSASSSGASDSSTSDTNPGTTPHPIYDVGHIPDTPGVACQDGGGMMGPDFSYIWIANSGQGTISKLNTATLEEVGRYITRPDGLGDPSRTSVSLNGDVAVANRAGGLAKFWAREADCVDRNGNGTIETSTGANDILDWDEEECRAWFTPMDYSSQRPVAWAPGQLDPDECRYFNEKVWTSGANDDFGGGGSGVDVILVDGDTGDIDDQVHIPEVVPQYFGIYGGAVDADGNFWGSQLGIGSLVKVDRGNLSYDVWPMANDGYGMTVDHTGHVWTCSYSGVGRFDPASETWETASVMGGGGCMEDGKGVLWLASNSLVGVDIETLDVVQTLAIPNYVHGVSIDFQGYVWGVTQFQPFAYRVDPETGDVETYSGLTEPYTYSDMTGFALANAGGWVPTG